MSHESFSSASVSIQIMALLLTIKSSKLNICCISRQCLTNCLLLHVARVADTAQRVHFLVPSFILVVRSLSCIFHSESRKTFRHAPDSHHTKHDIHYLKIKKHRFFTNNSKAPQNRQYRKGTMMKRIDRLSRC